MKKILNKKLWLKLLLIIIFVIATLYSDELFSFDDLSYTNNQLEEQEPILKIHFIDVGQADSIFIELPNKENMLIDAGNNADDKLVVDYIKKLKYDKIDYVIGTHPHEDHIGGLDKVIDYFDIGKIYMPKVSHNTKTFKDVLVSIDNKNLKITTAKAGINILDLEDLDVNIIAPVKNNYEDLNNYSAVLKIRYKNKTFLFMGDAEKISEQEIVEYMKADVLKVGHHGSRTSTSKEFLQKVKPTYAIITVGKDNDYNHPHSEVMKLLKDFNVNIYRTDKSGTIILSSDGNEINVFESNK